MGFFNDLYIYIYLILDLRNKIQEDESLKVNQSSKGEKMLHCKSQFSLVIFFKFCGFEALVKISKFLAKLVKFTHKNKEYCKFCHQVAKKFPTKKMLTLINGKQ
jgi:hypothetical protein